MNSKFRMSKENPLIINDEYHYRIFALKDFRDIKKGRNEK